MDDGPNRQQREQCLTGRIAALTGDAALERRHEALMAWAEADLALPREYAEQVYALAEEEEVQPVHALILVHCGIGVQELQPPQQDADEAAHQAEPPEWVETDQVEFADVALERRLRATFRRFRACLERAGTAAEAVHVFLGAADVGPVTLRWPGGSAAGES